MLKNYLQSVSSSIKKGIHSLLKLTDTAIDQDIVHQVFLTLVDIFHDSASVASAKILVHRCFLGHYCFLPASQ